MVVDTHTTFAVTPRELIGKKVSQLRKTGKIPANIMGLSKDSTAIVVDRVKFEKLYNEEGDTGLVYLEIEGSKKKVPVLIQDVQRDPMTGAAAHAVFKRVNLNVKVKAEVPVEVVGESKVDNAVLVLVRDAIEVEALPAELPENFTINAEEFTEIGHTVTVADLKYDKEKVEIVLSEDEDETAPIAILQEVKEVVEEPVETPEGDVATTETEASAEEKSAE